ncbi:hypothetical protein EMIT0P44_130071 [Pseudomonas sp. IT-P44]
MKTVRPSSTQRVPTSAGESEEWDMKTPPEVTAVRRRTAVGNSVFQPAGFFEHRGDAGGVFLNVGGQRLAFEEGGHQCVLFDVGLELRGFGDFAHQLDIERPLLGGDFAGHEHGAREAVLIDAQALLVTGRHVGPGFVAGDFLGVAHAFFTEHAQRLDLITAPLADAFAGVVDVGGDVFAGQLGRGFAAALERDVHQFAVCGLVQQQGEGLVHVLGLAAAHAQVRRVSLDRFVEALGVLPRCVFVAPENEVVLGHGGDGGQFLPLVAELGHQRQEVDVVGADHQFFWIALVHFQVEESFGAIAAALVEDDGIHVEQLVGGDDRLDQTAELVSAATGTASDDDFDVLVWLPGCMSESGKGAGGDQRAAKKQTGCATDECISHGRASFL